MTRLLLALALAPSELSAQSVPQSLPPAATVARTTDSLVQAFVAAGGAPSVAVGIMRGADTIALRAWGKADLEHEVPATAQTVYRIGSVTKQFTAAAVMQLVEQGKVRLTDSIAAYVPDLPAAWRPVTIRQLLITPPASRAFPARRPGRARRAPRSPPRRRAATRRRPPLGSS